MPMKVLDMFCGMSAFRTAAELIGGFSFVGYCDNDPTAIATYRTLYPTKGEYFCNDARAVNTDPRGTLFFELSRILEAKHPAYFIFENVPYVLLCIINIMCRK